MGSFITASGNIAEPPTLARDKETGRAYAYLRVLVSTDYRVDGGAWRKNPPTEYRVRVTGRRAERIAEVAARAGNVAIVFAGEVTEKPWDDAKRGGINRTIARPTIVGYDAIGQDVAIAPRGRARVLQPSTTAEPASGGEGFDSDVLADAWQGLADGSVQLHEVRDDVMALYWLGYEHGKAALMPQLEQAQRDADRLYVAAMNPADRAAAILARMDAVDTTDMSEQEAIEAHVSAASDVGALRAYQPDDTRSHENDPHQASHETSTHQPRRP